MSESSSQESQPSFFVPNTEALILKEKSAFIGSEDTRMKDEQKRLGMPITQLNVDIDNTFYRGDRDSASRLLAACAYEAHVPIHAITGGDFNGIYARIRKGELPYFQIISGKVGTERYALHIGQDGEKKYIRDEAYDEKLRSMDYNRLELAKTGLQTIQELGQTAHHPEWGLDFQNPKGESEFIDGQAAAPNGQDYKLSYYFYSESGTGEVRREMEKRNPGKKIVMCEEIGYNNKLVSGETRKKYCLDILPITKADALEDVSKITHTQINIIAGDSGNDSRMLEDVGDVSIAVGGAKPELLEALDTVISRQKTTPSMGKFDRIEEPNGQRKYYFREGKKYSFPDHSSDLSPQQSEHLSSVLKRLGAQSGSRMGPESIIYAFRVLVRASMIYEREFAEHYQLQLNENQGNIRGELARINRILNQPTPNPTTISQIYQSMD